MHPAHSWSGGGWLPPAVTRLPHGSPSVGSGGSTPGRPTPAHEDTPSQDVHGGSLGHRLLASPRSPTTLNAVVSSIPSSVVRSTPVIRWSRGRVSNARRLRGRFRGRGGKRSPWEWSSPVCHGAWIFASHAALCCWQHSSAATAWCRANRGS